MDRFTGTAAVLLALVCSSSLSRIGEARNSAAVTPRDVAAGNHPVSEFNDLPPGFVDERLSRGWQAPIGVVFDGLQRMFTWEKSGAVFISTGAQRPATPLIDIGDEVGDWRDFGLLGFALDPQFLSNGHFYLYYVVDRHHLLFGGTPSYDPNANDYFSATIGRVTRYTADSGTSFSTTIPGSRRVLLGETASSGVPILHESHGVGALMFSADGTLLVSAGDGASYLSVDTGSRGETYWSQALSTGIIRPEENVGAFRSQMIGSLSGKILRIDPNTGDGVSSNPFFDSSRPRAAASRVWSLGLRNPYRFTIRPGTGSTDPAAGRPGVLHIGDVGWTRWEDIEVAAGAGANFGWPLFEGLEPHPGYMGSLVANRDAPNPLFGTGGCGIEFFRFQDLLKQEQADHAPSFPNPCNPGRQISASTPTFQHTRPVIDYRHGQNLARTGVFANDGSAAVATVGSSNSSVGGSPFRGNASVGGVWHSGTNLPAGYGQSYFHADYGARWIRRIEFDVNHEPTFVHSFATVDSLSSLAEDPRDGSLLYVDYFAGEIRRIRYTGDSNRPPIAEVTSDVEFGGNPLRVRLDGSGSEDPDGQPLTYRWNFGDGSTGTGAVVDHTFRASSGLPAEFVATLTVTDPSGASDSADVRISPNNSPPEVEITSFASGRLFSTAQRTNLRLEARVVDAEHASFELSYEWQVALQHGSHFHAEPVDTRVSTQSVLSPLPCDGEFYAYRVTLKVTDPAGLVGTDEGWLFPDWVGSGLTAGIVSPAASAELTVGVPTQIEAQVAGGVERVSFFASGKLLGTRESAPWSLAWTPEQSGAKTLSLLIFGAGDSCLSSAGIKVGVAASRQLSMQIASNFDDAEESSSGSVNTTSSDLELTDDGGPQTVGMRFQAALPTGARVVSSHLQFTVDERSLNRAVLRIQGEASDDAAVIQRESFNLSSRPRTAAMAGWTPAGWGSAGAADADQRTPDLSAIVQEIIDRPGWRSGHSLLMLITGSGRRVAESYSGSVASAPRLAVSYTVENSPPRVDAGPDLSASIRAAIPLNGSVVDDGLPVAPLIAQWSKLSGPGSVSFVAADSARTLAQFSANGVYRLRLIGDDGQYQVSDEVEVTVSGSERRIEVRVSRRRDDGEQRSSGSTSRSSSDLELGADRGDPQVVGIRFAAPIPPGAQIVRAWVQFTVDEPSLGPLSLLIRGQNSDRAAEVGRSGFDLSSRPQTAASVAWDPAPWPQVGSNGPAQRTPDLAGIIQEIVDRPGWAAGNALMLLIREPSAQLDRSGLFVGVSANDGAAGSRTAESYDGVSSAAPLLVIDYR